MELAKRINYLRVVLIVAGVIFILGVYPAMILWPAGWRWIPTQPNYEQMLVGIYIVLGVFLLIAAKNPLQNLSIIWFTMWSSFVHGGIMLVQSIVYGQLGHLFGDVLALFLLGILLAILTPRKNQIS